MAAFTLHTKPVTTAEIHEKNIFYFTTAEIHEKNIFYCHYDLRFNFFERNLKVTDKLHKTVTKRLTFLITTIFVI